MTAPTEWLSGERPPLPRREKTVIFDAEFADRFNSATAELPVWPAAEPVEGGVPPVWPRGAEPPTVEFAPVRPRRSMKRWLLDNLTVKRIAAGGLSAVVFVVTGAGWFL